mmetsp:Transcript_18657/g.28390  ORF Transcript_18657/g.28390 Transcript_18657/m.28390 type:complete len:102 (-) Transcript_18657:505-810(-)
MDDSLSSLNGLGKLMEEMVFDIVDIVGTVHHEYDDDDDAELLLLLLSAELDGNFKEGEDIQSVAESTVCQALFIHDDEDRSIVMASDFNSSILSFSCCDFF